MTTRRATLLALANLAGAGMVAYAYRLVRFPRPTR